MEATIFWSPVKGLSTPVNKTNDYKYHCGNGATLEAIHIKDHIKSKKQLNNLIGFLQGVGHNLKE